MSYPFGQLFGLFLRYVQRSFICPHKFEKNLQNFLETAQIHRNYNEGSFTML